MLAHLWRVMSTLRPHLGAAAQGHVYSIERAQVSVLRGESEGIAAGAGACVDITAQHVNSLEGGCVAGLCRQQQRC